MNTQMTILAEREVPLLMQRKPVATLNEIHAARVRNPGMRRDEMQSRRACTKYPSEARVRCGALRAPQTRICRYCLMMLMRNLCPLITLVGSGADITSKSETDPEIRIAAN